MTAGRRQSAPQNNFKPDGNNTSMTSSAPPPGETENFLRRIRDLEKILAQMEEYFPDNSHLERWRQALPGLAELRRSYSLPLTCIGPVKSGKSTLINTLAGADLLPTGAGITTSFPTTVRAGKSFSARISLQPEETIREIFSQALELLFGEELEEPRPELFNPDDRARLMQLLDTCREQGGLTRHGIFDESYRLLRNLARGAERVAEYYRQQELEFTTADPEDQRYRDFIREEELSAYLKEVAIQAPLRLLPAYLALRDLPGLDTPNPSHQGLIIQQVGESPGLIYVISSRIGLRQADYQLLEHLRGLGLETRLLFVLNLDLDAHRDETELRAMTRRCREELHELGFNQPLYAFSALALYWTRSARPEALGAFEKERLERWQQEEQKFALAREGAESFLEKLAELGRNEATTALLEHSRKRLRQVIGGARRLLAARIAGLEGRSRDLDGDRQLRESDRQTLEAVLREIDQITVGIRDQVEKFAFNETARWLDRRGDDGLRRQLGGIVKRYQPPLDQIPEKYRNPLTPVKIISNHFQMTVPPQLSEKTVLETLAFLAGLHREINRRLLDGCAPLFVISERFTGRDRVAPEELPLPVRIEPGPPAFTMTSEAEQRFALLDRIREVVTLWGGRIFSRRRAPLGEAFAEQLKRDTLKELPRWLGNYQEQVKYVCLRRHLEECRKLINGFFIDLLAGSGVVLEDQAARTADQEAAARQQLARLKELAAELEQL